MPKATTPPHLITLIFLAGLSPLSLNMFSPSLANIAEDLSTDYATVSLAIGGYLATTAVIQLIIGPLSDRIGRRPVILGALAVFTLASIVCALAEDVGTFLMFRMFQAGMAAGFSLSLAVVRDTTSEQKAAGMIAFISMSMAIAPMTGPMMGGILDTAFGWRANFWFYAISGSILLALCWVDLGETRPDRSGETGLAPETTLSLVREPLFWAFALCNAFSTGGFFVFVTGAPLVARSAFEMTSAELGFCVGTITAGFMLGSFISSRLAPRARPTAMMLAGRLITFTGLAVGLAILSAGWLSPWLYFGSTVFIGLGNGITMPSSNAGVLSIRPKLAGTASGLNAALVVAIGAVLTTLTGHVLPQDGAAPVLMTMLLGTAVAGLLAVLWAIRLRRPHPAGA